MEHDEFWRTPEERHADAMDDIAAGIADLRASNRHPRNADERRGSSEIREAQQWTVLRTIVFLGGTAIALLALGYRFGGADKTLESLPELERTVRENLSPEVARLKENYPALEARVKALEGRLTPGYPPSAGGRR